MTPKSCIFLVESPVILQDAEMVVNESQLVQFAYLEMNARNNPKSLQPNNEFCGN